MSVNKLTELIDKYSKVKNKLAYACAYGENRLGCGYYPVVTGYSIIGYVRFNDDFDGQTSFSSFSYSKGFVSLECSGPFKGIRLNSLLLQVSGPKRALIINEDLATRGRDLKTIALMVKSGVRRGMTFSDGCGSLFHDALGNEQLENNVSGVRIIDYRDSLEKAYRDSKEQSVEVGVSTHSGTPMDGGMMPPSIITNVDSTTGIKEDSMSRSLDMSKLTEQLFRREENIVWDIQQGKLGIMSNDGIGTFVPAVMDGDGKKVVEEATVASNPINDLGLKIPAFSVRVTLDQIENGDIVTISGFSRFVTSIKGNKVEMIGANGVKASATIPVNTMFGNAGVLVCKNVFGNTTKDMGDASTGGLNPMMLALLAGDEIDPMMLMMMGGMGGGGAGGMGGMNPMILLMLSRGKDGKGVPGKLDDILPLMMMGGMMGGNSGGINPLMMSLLLSKKTL